MIFIVPDIAGTPTGGNIYNRRVLDHWPERAESPSVRTWPVDTPPAPPHDDLPPGTVVLVDSLCLKHGAALREWRTEHPTARLFVLAHYLACVDPRETSSDDATAERALLPLLDGAITPSTFVREALVREGMPPGAVHAVPPGLDDRFRIGDASDVNAQPTAPGKEAPRLLTVANVLPGKGLDLMLDALGALQDRAWTWHLVGGTELDAAYGASFREKLHASPIRDRVRWEGTVPGREMPAVYDAADVFVLPTRFETCSMATREAMARGRPVVASRVGGLPENLGDAEAGCLVPRDDPYALAQAIGSLLDAPQKRQAMGRAAEQRSRDFPTWTDTAHRVAEALGGSARDRT